MNRIRMDSVVSNEINKTPDVNTDTYAYKSGLSRRAFLKQTGMGSLLAGLLITKPAFSDVFTASGEIEATDEHFSSSEQSMLEAVQLQLFPDDGDGPSATDINAYHYLDWALEDPQNKADGDRNFIRSGLIKLTSLSAKQHQHMFVKLPTSPQHQLITEFFESDFGSRWVSLLVYYLLEALLLDPVYGGNTNEVGWKWLEHQPGFPRPTPQRNYRHYV